MKTKAAVVYEFGKPIEIEELDLDGPREGEVLIRYTHAGLCHSDIHVAHGDLEARLPMVLGHEGAGIIEEVGPGVTRVKVGDHVVFSFVPACGKCPSCSRGRFNLCDTGANALVGSRPDDPTSFRMHLDGQDVGQQCGIPEHRRDVLEDDPELRKVRHVAQCRREAMAQRFSLRLGMMHAAPQR